MKKSTLFIESGVASHPLPGENQIGDTYLIEPFSNGVLIAAADGLGHGEEAEKAANVCANILKMYAGQPVENIVRFCHKALLKTRGVVLSLASFSSLDNTMTWLGVGNVEGVMIRLESQNKRTSAQEVKITRESLLLRSGVVGYQLPSLRPATIQLKQNDTLIFATDGIHNTFTEGLAIMNQSPQNVAEQILAKHFKGTDDALVLVARWRNTA